MANILVAGSNFSETQARALLLEFLGHHCETAASLGEAVELLKDGRAELLISEEYDPCGSRSAETIDSLKRTSREVAWMVLAREPVRDSNRDAEADEVLAIPCTLDGLLLGIDRALDKFRSCARSDSGNSMLRTQLIFQN